MLSQDFTSLFIILAALQCPLSSNGEKNTLCYIRKIMPQTQSDVCVLPMSVTCCIPHLSVDRIDVYGETTCNTVGQCGTPKGCCETSEKLNVSEDYVVSLRESFKSTNCFNDVNKQTFDELPFNEGLVTVVVSYSCTGTTTSTATSLSTTATITTNDADSTATRSNASYVTTPETITSSTPSTTIHAETTPATTNNTESSVASSNTVGVSSKPATKISSTPSTTVSEETTSAISSTPTTTTTITTTSTTTTTKDTTTETKTTANNTGQSVAESDTGDDSKTGVPAAAVTVPVVIVLIIVAVIVAVFFIRRRRAAKKGMNQLEMEPDTVSFNGQVPATEYGKGFALPTSYDESINSEYAEIDGNRNSSLFGESNEYNTISLKHLPVAKHPGHGHFPTSQRETNENYDHIGVQSPARRLGTDTYAHIDHAAGNKHGVSNGGVITDTSMYAHADTGYVGDTYSHINHGGKQMQAASTSCNGGDTYAHVNHGALQDDTYDTTSTPGSHKGEDRYTSEESHYDHTDENASRGDLGQYQDGGDYSHVERLPANGHSNLDVNSIDGQRNQSLESDIRDQNDERGNQHSYFILEKEFK